MRSVMAFTLADLAAHWCRSSDWPPRFISPPATSTATSRRAPAGRTSDRGSQHRAACARGGRAGAGADAAHRGGTTGQELLHGSRASIPASIPGTCSRSTWPAGDAVSIRHGADRVLRRGAAAARAGARCEGRWAPRRCCRSADRGPPPVSRSRATSPLGISRARGATCAS